MPNDVAALWLPKAGETNRRQINQIITNGTKPDEQIRPSVTLRNWGIGESTEISASIDVQPATLPRCRHALLLNAWD